MYLVKINSYYYFNYRVPNLVNNYFKSKVIKQSLKTKNLKIAKSLATILYNNLQKFIWMVQYQMITSTMIDKIVEGFKSFNKDRLYTELKESPDPKSWIVEDLDIYDDIIKDYKKVKYSNETDYVKDDVEYLIKSYDDLDFTEDNKIELAQKVAQSHIEVLIDTKQEFKDGIYDNSYKKGIDSNIDLKTDTIEPQPIKEKESKPKEINSNHPINNIQSTKNIISVTKDNSYTIKDKFNEWIAHKEQVEKLSTSSIKDYKAAYRYLILFFN